MLARRQGIGVSAWCAVVILILAAGLPTALGGPPVTVQLLADRSAVAPGQAVSLALRFEIGDEHHIYWRHPGDAGAATVVRWTSTDQASFGVLRFPVPQKLALADGRASYVLRYEATLLTTLTVPKDATPGQPLTIRGEVQYALGGAQLSLGHSPVELQLPVVSPGQQGEPVNKEVFEEAAYSRPVPADKAKHLKLRTELKPPSVQPGGKATAIFVVDIKKGFHIQAHEPGAKGLIGADLFFAPPPGITVGQPVFPKGKTREVKYLGKVNEYVGQVKFEVSLTVTADYAGHEPLAGLLLYQACDEKTGVCFPPEYVSWALKVPTGK